MLRYALRVNDDELDDDELHAEKVALEVEVDYLKHKIRWVRIRAGVAGLLLGLAFAMLGNLIAYGVQHDSVQVMVVGSVGAVGLFGYWVLTLWPLRP